MRPLEAILRGLTKEALKARMKERCEYPTCRAVTGMVNDDYCHYHRAVAKEIETRP